MTERAARAVYAGTRDITERNLRMLGRMEMCQRNRRAAKFARWYDRRQGTLWYRRRHPPIPPASAAGGWAIPWPIVQCESGGHNDPPNSAGASGYYQDMPSTWAGYGGYPAAYLAPKAVQDRFNARLWRNGAGSGNWTCAGLVAW